jgi:hypothetical protein
LGGGFFGSGSWAIAESDSAMKTESNGTISIRRADFLKTDTPSALIGL